MKVIIIHGNNYIKGYERVQFLINIAKDRGWDIIRIVNNEIKLKEILSRQALFNKERLIILEDIEQLIKENCDFINNYKDSDTTLIIFHDSEIARTKIKYLDNIHKIELYELPKILWLFLDGIYPGNTEKTIKLFHNLIDKEPKELMFQFIAQRFGDLYWATQDSKSMKIDKWRIDKLIKQSQHFSKDKLLEIITQLSEIDIKSKRSDGELITMLDFMFMKHLK